MATIMSIRSPGSMARKGPDPRSACPRPRRHHPASTNRPATTFIESKADPARGNARRYCMGSPTMAETSSNSGGPSCAATESESAKSESTIPEKCCNDIVNVNGREDLVMTALEAQLIERLKKL